MATDMFLKLADVEKETQRHDHARKIEILSWNFGGSNSASMSGESGMGAGKVDLQDISFTKWVDKTSPILFQKMCSGWHFPEATLSVYKAGGEKPLKYLQLDFKDMLLTSISTGGSGGEDRLTENMTMAFTKVTLTYTVQTADGTKKGEEVGSWNLATNKAE
jgi:type VI secretion system secreted protein Hcp